MKRLAATALIVFATCQMHANTIEQIKTTINEINKRLSSNPELKSLLDEQAKLYNMQKEIDDKFGVADIDREYLLRDKQICLEAQTDDPAITQQKIAQNQRDRKNKLRKRPLMLDEEDHIAVRRVDQIRNEVMENPRVKDLFDRLENLKNQLRNEKPCEWKEIAIGLEKGLLLKKVEYIY